MRGRRVFTIPTNGRIHRFSLSGKRRIDKRSVGYICRMEGTNSDRVDFLDRISGIEGIYVPRFYSPEYNSDGTLKATVPSSARYPGRIRKRVIKDLERSEFPDKMVVPNIGIVHDRIMLELFRGCTRGCRFCQAGFVYRPVREKMPERLICQASGS